ncbi:MAG: AccI family restriction endonuclease [Planctomycetota bacterium]
MARTPDLFNLALQLPADELFWEISDCISFAPAQIDFLINPRRLRGSDFLMRWSQGRWSEDIVIATLNATKEFGVLPYGPSAVAPDDPKELEQFFETMDRVAKKGKRPDLLLYDKETFEWASKEVIHRIGDLDKLPMTPSEGFVDIIGRTKAALDVENSLWVTEKMPGFGKSFSRFIRGKKKGRLKASGIVPTIIIKQEDIPGLPQWEQTSNVPIYVVHIFYDRGYFIQFREILKAVEQGDVGLEEQKYTNPDGTASSPKQIIKVPYILCKEFGKVCEPQLMPKTFIDKNGKVMTYVVFSGGSIHLSDEVFSEWGR